MIESWALPFRIIGLGSAGEHPSAGGNTERLASRSLTYWHQALTVFNFWILFLSFRQVVVGCFLPKTYPSLWVWSELSFGENSENSRSSKTRWNLVNFSERSWNWVFSVPAPCKKLGIFRAIFLAQLSKLFCVFLWSVSKLSWSQRENLLTPDAPPVSYFSDFGDLRVWSIWLVFHE